jgi:antirestriction protein
MQHAIHGRKRTTTTETPQVWIGCLAAYNGGCLHGKWVDATDADEMEATKDEIIKTSPALLPEEWFIADYDNFPAAIVRELGEHASFETVANVATALEEHGAAFAAWLSVQDSGLDLAADDLGEQFEEHYRGEWDSEEAYAMETACELGWSNVPAILYYDGYGGHDKRNRCEVFDALAGYLDWKSIARDMFQHGEYTYVDGYVFED